MLKNKFFSSCIAFAFIIALIICFFLLGKIDFSDSDNYSESFKGSLSQNTYSSKSAAARAFVSEELSGINSDPKYVGYKKIGDLTKTELTAIKTQDTIDEDLKNGEKVEINYVISATQNNVNAYLIETDYNYRYYVLPPEPDEPITNTYLNSVLDGAKYLNCTSTTTVGSSILDIMTTYKQVIKFDNDKAHFNQEIPGLIRNVYLEEYPGGLTAYLEHPDIRDGKLYEISEIQSYYAQKNLLLKLYLMKGDDKVSIDKLNSMQDVTDFAFMLDVDASFFVKTDYGFAMENDKYKAVCKMLAGNTLDETFDKIWNDYKVYFHSEYYVSEGRLEKINVKLRLLYDNNFLTIDLKSEYTDFGKTKVIIPDRY